MTRLTTRTEDRQPALGRIVCQRLDCTVTKLPVWTDSGHALIVITEYTDGRVTLSASEATR
ncbi:MAG TPA: hypothetical protein PKC83_11200 [Gemmatimonadaceae bacterium]|nr:hypothetical protein [Gemmatimonadaceae bacterium]